ncbi:helix-turn-helix domain-containing protein [Kineococcus sp. SYSU DK003]|uniref:helix-turn-helix domain-containing protein n=1 Tax=Kineococcus sp. SYSU DK003 TaxID=3383124 RepID=UPI003D7D8857
MDGFRIREVRVAQGLTIAQLATAAGVSAAMVSQVERGLADPSLATLRQFARALDVPLFDLFEAAPRVSPVAVTRAGKQVTITSPNGDTSYARLSVPYGQLEVLRGELRPGGVSHEEPWSHPAHECVTVVQGRLLVEVDGEFHRLEEGDSCYFDSRLPHRLVNETEQPTRFIVAVTPPSY